MKQNSLLYILIVCLLFGSYTVAQENCTAVTRIGSIDETGILDIKEEIPGDCGEPPTISTTTQSIVEQDTQEETIEKKHKQLGKSVSYFIGNLLTIILIINIIYVVGSIISPKREGYINQLFIRFISKHE